MKKVPVVVRKEFSKKELANQPTTRLSEEATDDFQSDSEESLNILVNVVSILPYEYGCISGENAEEVVVKESPEFETEEMALHKPVCYFVLNNGSVESQEAFFEKPTMGMKNHFKPLMIRENVEGVAINKVLVDCGTTVNIMPAYILKKIGKYENEVRPNNMVLSNYGGKTAHTLGVI